MTTDLHTHLGETRMKYSNVNPGNVLSEADTLISRMNTFGVSKAVLTAFGSVECNELYLKAAEAHPDRLFPACVIPPRPKDDALWLLKQYKDQQVSAIVIDEDIITPIDPAVEHLIDQAIEMEMPVFYHFSSVGPEGLRLIDRMSEKYPSGKFVVLSMGGLFAFPHLLTIANRKNIWIEISDTIIKLVESPLRIFIDALLQDRGANRLVFGSEHHSEYQNLLVSLNQLNINIEDLEIIKQQNAWIILGLDFS